MKQPIRKTLFTAIVIVLLLAACAPAEQPPAEDPVLFADTIGTYVALTVDARNLQVAQATQTPTSGFVPEILVTDTPGFTPEVLETDTPVPTPDLPRHIAIEKVTPNDGPIAGGTTVTIIGTDLWLPQEPPNQDILPIIEFGLGNAATNVRCSTYSVEGSTSNSKCLVTSPESQLGAPEVVTIAVTLNNVTTQPDQYGRDRFTYIAQPKTVCNIFTQSPDHMENIKAGSSFDIKWIIINTGSTTWPAGLDVKYSSGPQMTKQTRVEISKALKPNERYTIVLDAVAPKQTGPQYMTWIIEGQLCSPSVIINVVEK